TFRTVPRNQRAVAPSPAALCPRAHDAAHRGRGVQTFSQTVRPACTLAADVVRSIAVERAGAHARIPFEHAGCAARRDHAGGAGAEGTRTHRILARANRAARSGRTRIGLVPMLRARENLV